MSCGQSVFGARWGAVAFALLVVVARSLAFEPAAELRPVEGRLLSIDRADHSLILEYQVGDQRTQKTLRFKPTLADDALLVVGSELVVFYDPVQKQVVAIRARYDASPEIRPPRPQGNERKKATEPATPGSVFTLERARRMAEQCASAADAVILYGILLRQGDLTAEQRTAAQDEMKQWQALAAEGRVRVGEQLLPPAEAAAARRHAAMIVAQALELLKLGNLELAREKLEEADKLFPEQVLPRATLALISIVHQRDYDDARALLQACRERQPRNVATLNNLGLCELRLGHYSAAAKWLAMALAHGPRTAEVAHNAGRLIQEAASGNVNAESNELKPLADLYSFLAANKVVPPADPSRGWLFMLPAVEPLDVPADEPPPQRVADNALVQVATGTGFSVGPGLFITNLHVIEGATTIELYPANDLAGTGVRAEIVARSSTWDLALLRSAQLALPPLSIDENLPARSSEVLAFGFPVTDIVGKGLKATRGIVSGLPDEQTQGFLVFDAIVNPGNSGGPLCNALGGVVGVVTAKSAQSNKQLIESYGLAIPATEVAAFLRAQNNPIAPPRAGRIAENWAAVDAAVSGSMVRVSAIMPPARITFEKNSSRTERVNDATAWEDKTCPRCRGTKLVDCPVRDCANGRVGREMTKKFGENLDGSAIIGNFKGRVRCDHCDGKGRVACPLCGGQGEDPRLR